jgi:hypothetical protein
LHHAVRVDRACGGRTVREGLLRDYLDAQFGAVHGVSGSGESQ